VLAQPHAPSVGHHQADGHVEAGGLAGAVGAEEPHHLARADLEGHAVHHPAAAVGLHELLGAEEGLAHRCPPRFCFRFSWYCFTFGSTTLAGTLPAGASIVTSSLARS